jgi:hypothetical protein
VIPGAESTDVNWRELYEKAQNVARQWEAQDKYLEEQIAAQLHQMDAATRETIKKEKVKPLPSAPIPNSTSAKTASPSDYKILFYLADERGKAWRARANILDAQYRSNQDRLSAQRIKNAGTPTYAYLRNAPAKSPHATATAKPAHVKKYIRSDGTYVVPSVMYR